MTFKRIQSSRADGPPANDTSVVYGFKGQPYRWSELDAWPASASPVTGWAHTDVVVTSDGSIVTGHPDGDSLVVLPPAPGDAFRLPISGMTGPHGMDLTSDPLHGEVLWVTDVGGRNIRQPDGSYQSQAAEARVLKLTLSGSLLAQIPRPDLAIYDARRFMPTGVSVDAMGDGDIWVADGYGGNVVHHFDAVGGLLATLTGHESGAGGFDCPHAVFVDRRRDEPLVYVTDRGHERVMVYTFDGLLRRVITEAELSKPSAFARYEDFLIVAELGGRLSFLDLDDRVVARLGNNISASDRPGWPNALDGRGLPIRAELQPGRFNSPHGVATDASGRLYVAEFLIGGRLIELSPC